MLLEPQQGALGGQNALTKGFGFTRGSCNRYESFAAHANQRGMSGHSEQPSSPLCGEGRRKWKRRSPDAFPNSPMDQFSVAQTNAELSPMLKRMRIDNGENGEQRAVSAFSVAAEQNPWGTWPATSKCTATPTFSSPLGVGGMDIDDEGFGSTSPKSSSSSSFITIEPEKPSLSSTNECQEIVVSAPSARFRAIKRMLARISQSRTRAGFAKSDPMALESKGYMLNSQPVLKMPASLAIALRDGDPKADEFAQKMQIQTRIPLKSKLIEWLKRQTDFNEQEVSRLIEMLTDMDFDIDMADVAAACRLEEEPRKQPKTFQYEEIYDDGDTAMDIDD